MRYLILNADTPTGFYLINQLTNKKHDVDPIIIGDGEGDNFIHPQTTYYNPADINLYSLKSNNYDGIFFIADTHRIYAGFADRIYALFYFEKPIVAIFDWEIYNGVKRGNFPVSTATSTKPDNFRGISKVWIKDTLLHASKTMNFPIGVIVTPTVLSPFHLVESIRKDSEYYIAQKLWEAIEAFKTGEFIKVNKGDLRVIYDIVHNIDVAKSAIALIQEKGDGFFMLSSNIFLRFNEILEEFYGRLIGSPPIKLEDTGIEIIDRRRSIENYDTTIDMVYLWTDIVYNSKLTLRKIFDDIIQVLLNSEKEYQIAQNVYKSIS